MGSEMCIRDSISAVKFYLGNTIASKKKLWWLLDLYVSLRKLLAIKRLKYCDPHILETQ